MKSFIDKLSNSNGSLDVETAIEEIRENFQHIEGEGRNDLIAKRATVFLLTQIAEGCVRGFDYVKEKLENHYFPLGYLAGFSVRFILAFKVEDKHTQTAILKKVFSNIYPDDSAEFFDKTFDPKNADNHVFKRGTERGWQDVEDTIAEEKQPTGLISFFLEE